MKFKLLREVSGGPRVGSMILGREECPTPGMLTSTPGGCVPNLTRETLELMQKSPFPLGIPYNAIIPETLEAYQRPMNDFMGLPEYPFILILHEGSEAQRLGFFSKDSVSVWSTSGNRHTVRVEDYLRVVKASQPDAFVALSDSLTPQDSTKKRLQKSVTKSLRFLSQILEHEGGDLPPLLVPLGGGYDSELRTEYRKSVLEADQNRISGYVIEGFHTGGLASTQSMSMGEILPLMNLSLQDLPQSKPRFMVGAFDPWKTLCLVESGVDVFESSYPHLSAERGEALSFDPSGMDSREDSLLDLNDVKYKNSFEPLVSNCSCYVCEHHTQAYVHHLLSTKELLARVILMMHNLTHFRTFFKFIRQSIEADRFQDYKERMKKYSSDK
uniref:Queuine tRNA-ribosyltransferase accessory subunit 2 n=1 Tax=Caligus rogercresseyi TaxID=217165 RepID=C1BMD9_CALRO|nr:Queuine tRNA-ribosyltransferase domain-containing protein 1 [Caligus rogercresseyi]